MDVRPDVIHSGVSAWDRAHSRLEEANNAAKAGITGLDPAAVFGNDTVGRTFLSQYLQNGGPAELLFGANGGGGITTQLGEGGPSITSALNEVLAQEAANTAANTRLGGAGTAPPSARA